jgi:Flp pilus assembly protein TadG
MRRLRPRHPLSRLREERGGIAVMLALLMPVLFGAAAIALDTAAVWSARQQVENGADAAVLAVAMDCARGDCGDIKQTAIDAFFANNRAAKLSNLGSGEGYISVSGREVSVEQKRPWVVNHFFAAALGQGTGELSVQSYAEWAPATSGRADIPFAISWCTYLEEVGTNGPDAADTATLTLDTVSGAATCTGPSGTETVPNGAAMTQPDSNSCRTSSTQGGTVTVIVTKYGTSVDPRCTDARLAGLVGRDIWLPVWDTATPTTDASPTIRVHGYAAFRVTGYSTTTPSLTGHFTRAPRQTNATTPPATNAPDLGARSVYLTKD